jgi:hypothetical protein
MITNHGASRLNFKHAAASFPLKTKGRLQKTALGGSSENRRGLLSFWSGAIILCYSLALVLGT